MLEMFSWIKLGASYVLKALKFLVPFMPKLWNIFRRPQLEIKLRQGHVVFKTADEKEQRFPYIYLQITNRTNHKLYINPATIRINNEYYQVFVQGDINYCKMLPASQGRWTFCDNEIYNTFLNNWLAICENRYSFPFGSHHTLTFPIKGHVNALTQRKKNSLLFFSNNKISLTLDINGKNREYCIIKRKPAYEIFLSYLSANQTERR